MKFVSTLIVVFSITIAWFDVVVATAAESKATDRFDQAHLKKYRTELFDYYPPTVCAIKALLGAQYDNIKENEYKGGLSGMETPWEISGKDGDVIISHCNWANDDKRLLWIHPRGSILVATKRGNTITLYTNDRSVKNDLPKGVKMFIDQTTTSGAKVSWNTPPGPGIKLPPSCTEARMQAESRAFDMSSEGLSSDSANIKYMTFSQTPYVVFPKDKLGRKVPLLKTPGEDVSGKSPYLVAGDMVQPVKTDFKVKPVKGHLNVYYRNSTGREFLGWVKQEDLLPVGDSFETSMTENLAKLPAISWFNSSHSKLNFPGRYADDHSTTHSLKVEKMPDGLHASIKGPSCNGTPDLKLINARVAQLTESSEDDRFDMYLFNNGIFVHSVNEFLEDGGPNFWAICYPTVSAKATK